MCDSVEKDYKLCEEIGRGRFGVVYRCCSLACDRFFACKSINKASISDDAIDRRCIDVEPKILSLLSGCPNIVALHGVYETDEYIHLITDLCDGGNLYDRISCGRHFTEIEAAAVLKQLMVAIACCHRFGLAHRDIKPCNILFDSVGQLMLADFGSAEFFRVSEMTGVVGTPHYIAPEVLIGGDYTEKVDIWSAGVILYIMLAGVFPFNGEGPSEIFQALLHRNLRFPSQIFGSVSTEAKDLLRKMICRDVSRRLSAEQVLKHPFLQLPSTMAEAP